MTSEHSTPTGWRLMPERPTPEMLGALRVGSSRDVPSDQLCDVRYRALLASAPKPPALGRKPMTDAALHELRAECRASPAAVHTVWWVLFARAIERHHKIGDEA